MNRHDGDANDLIAVSASGVVARARGVFEIPLGCEPTLKAALEDAPSFDQWHSAGYPQHTGVRSDGSTTL